MVANELNAVFERALLKVAGGKMLLQAKVKEADVARCFLDEQPGALFGEMQYRASVCLGLLGIGEALAFADERTRARDRLVFGSGVGHGAFDFAGVEREGKVGEEPVA